MLFFICCISSSWLWQFTRNFDEAIFCWH